MSYIIKTLGDKETAISYLDAFYSGSYDRDILRLKEEMLGEVDE